MGLLHRDCAHWSSQQIISCRCHFIGSAIQLFEGLALHLQLHLRILFEDLRVGLAKHLRYPLVGYSSGTQPCGVCGAKIVRAIGANLAETLRLIRPLLPCKGFRFAQQETSMQQTDGQGFSH